MNTRNLGSRTNRVTIALCVCSFWFWSFDESRSVGFSDKGSGDFNCFSFLLLFASFYCF